MQANNREEPSVHYMTKSLTNENPVSRVYVFPSFLPLPTYSLPVLTSTILRSHQPPKQRGQTYRLTRNSSFYMINNMRDYKRDLIRISE